MFLGWNLRDLNTNLQLGKWLSRWHNVGAGLDKRQVI